MHTNTSYNPGQIGSQKTTGNITIEDSQKETEISLPDEKVYVGPFIHSGETAGWTETNEKQDKFEESQKHPADK